MRSGLSESELFVSGVTGSTGSGRSPQAGTHHPERNSNLYAYKPLDHRHSPEVTALANAASGRETKRAFRTALGSVRKRNPRNIAGEGKVSC